MFTTQASPLEKISSRLFPNTNLWVKRDDLLHPTVSGNKARKLKYQLQFSEDQRPKLLTMGGAWSNHLHATAYAAQLLGLESIGIVRGPHHLSNTLTPTLEDCQRVGMLLIGVNHDQYRQLRQPQADWSAMFIQQLEDQIASKLDQTLWLPEGGSAATALRGVAEIIEELPTKSATIAVACGTGASLAGLLAGLGGQGKVLGVAVLKQAAYLHIDIARLLRAAQFPVHNNYELLLGFHHGGYARFTPELLSFCADFSADTGISIEPVYTGKLFFALHKLAQASAFAGGRPVIAIHTGGLQGVRSQHIYSIEVYKK
ncbi:MAG: pyridoxal-phosphate dependent enzyme [Burkholderiaceae bacterium]|nr:pyridoxal-phosphate dependent enzyme [Burkholderiaceae bacterium]